MSMDAQTVSIDCLKPTYMESQYVTIDVPEVMQPSTSPMPLQATHLILLVQDDTVAILSDSTCNLGLGGRTLAGASFGHACLGYANY